MGDVSSDVFDHAPHGGGTGVTGPQLLGDVEAALAALKGSAVFGREPQTVEAMERLVTAKIAEQRAVELDEGHTVNTPCNPVCFINVQRIATRVHVRNYE
jgi:hypothetical protein